MASQARFPQKHSSGLAFRRLVIPQPLGRSPGLQVGQDGRAALMHLEKIPARAGLTDRRPEPHFSLLGRWYVAEAAHLPSGLADAGLRSRLAMEAPAPGSEAEGRL